MLSISRSQCHSLGVLCGIITNDQHIPLSQTTFGQWSHNVHGDSAKWLLNHRHGCQWHSPGPALRSLLAHFISAAILCNIPIQCGPVKISGGCVEQSSPFPDDLSWATLRTTLRHCIGSINCSVVISSSRPGGVQRRYSSPSLQKKPIPGEQGWPPAARLTASKVMSVDCRVLSCSAQEGSSSLLTGHQLKPSHHFLPCPWHRRVVLHVSEPWIVGFWSILCQRDHYRGWTSTRRLHPHQCW